MLGKQRDHSPIDRLSPRELEVLAHLTVGRSKAAIAAPMHVGGGALEKHVANVFTRLDIAPSTNDHRRVVAVLAYLDSDR